MDIQGINPLKFLLIEDNPDDVIILREILSAKNGDEVWELSIELDSAVNCEEAEEKLKTGKYDLVALDLSLPESSGLDTIRRFKGYFSKYPFIILTGLDDKLTGINSIKIGAQDFLVKRHINRGLFFKAVMYSIERHKLLQKVQQLSFYDDLTGLNNRRGFFHLLEHQVRNANRKKKPFLLFYLDMDNLKTINDSLGHLEGDRAIIDIADILRKVFRTSDILVRIGGDEFCVFPLDAELRQEEAILKRLNDGINEFNNTSSRRFKISISTGKAVYSPDKPESIDELISRADTEMYAVKRLKKLTLAQG